MANKGGYKRLKRLAAPKSWNISRKDNTWAIEPRPGPHSKKTGIPLGIVVRDMLNLAKNMREVKYILRNGKIKVDGEVRRDYRFQVGFMDTISIPTMDKYYRMLYDRLGRLGLVEIGKDEAGKKIVRVNGKRKIKAGKIQLNLHDGRNIITTDNSIKTGDSLLISVPNQGIENVIKLEKGMTAYIIGKSHSGELAEIVDVIPGTISREPLVKLKEDENEIMTKKEYVFVVGKEEPLIKIR